MFGYPKRISEDVAFFARAFFWLNMYLYVPLQVTIWLIGSALVSAGRKNKKNLEEIKELWKSICKDRSSDGKPEQEQHQQPQTTGTTTTTTTNNKNNNKSNSKNNKNNNKSNSKNNKNNNKSHNNKVGVGSCQVFGWGGGGGGEGGGGVLSSLWLGVLFVPPPPPPQRLDTTPPPLPPPPLRKKIFQSPHSKDFVAPLHCISPYPTTIYCISYFATTSSYHNLSSCLSLFLLYLYIVFLISLPSLIFIICNPFCPFFFENLYIMYI